MNTYRLLFSDLTMRLRWRLPALVVLMTVVGFTEGLSIALLLPLLTKVGIEGSGKSAAATAINDFIDFAAPEAGIGAILAVIIILALIQAVVFIGQTRWTARLVCNYAANWQIALFNSFMRADWLFLTSRKAGDLNNAIIVESWRVASAFLYFLYVFSAAIAAAIYLCFALLVSWKATLLLLALASIMVLSIARLYRISDSVGRRTGPLNAQLQVLISESLAAAKIIKATVSEERVVTRASGVVRELEGLSRTAMFVPSFVRGLFELMTFVALAAFLAFGMAPLNVAPADAVIVLALFVRLFPRFTNAQTLFQQFLICAPAIFIVRQMLAEANARGERVDQEDAALKLPLPTRLEASGVYAAFGDNVVLKGIDIKLDVPGMVGIVGGSGAGKSTLVHTLIGLVAPRAGTIRLGPHNLANSALAAWRHTIGYVPQETSFFHASVTENLKLAKPGATSQEIIAAARRADAHDFIMELPHGYDTQIGDQGVLLSGGQRQRLSIARALVAQPLLLLLDEPTSALDSLSELEVLATLNELRRTVGVIIVAHRVTTVRAADRIYVLDDGCVVEEGNWSDLINRRQRFHELARLQQIVA